MKAQIAGVILLHTSVCLSLTSLYGETVFVTLYMALLCVYKEKKSQSTKAVALSQQISLLGWLDVLKQVGQSKHSTSNITRNMK